MAAINPERLRQIEELYHLACECEPGEQEAFLASACRNDEELLLELRSLLAQNGASGVMDRRASQVAAGLLRDWAPGAQVGPYQIVSRLGEGGMGAVYRARDIRLGREVAIKNAHQEFSGRFQREARAISALNHPHICTLHDIGPDYLVMELVEGETLAGRLQKGRLPLELVLRYAGQIADALGAAHAKGITHRDLKPANLMITRAGIKVLDFGLAKFGGSHDPAGSHAETATASHTIVGTPAYMSPEQLEGKPCDARTDIFALGLVLYEMAAGKPAFTGASRAALSAAILRGRSAPLHDVPPAFAHVVECCLAKDPDDRWQSARDIKQQLEYQAHTLEEPKPEAAPAVVRTLPKRRLLWFALAAVAVLAAGAVGYGLLRQQHPAERMLRYFIPPPERSSIHSIALSADGRQLAIAAAVDGNRQLWLRPLDGLDVRVLPGTEDAAFPFWSPNGEWIGFFAQDKLKKIAATGGPPQTLCDAPSGDGGAWNREGVVVFSTSAPGGLRRVSAAGGVASLITKEGPDAKNSHHPIFLPDGRRFLFTESGVSGFGTVRVGSLDGQPSRELISQLSPLAYVPAQAGSKLGHVLFLRRNTLLAQPVDEASMQVAGELFPVSDQISFATYARAAPFAASNDGVLIFQAGGNPASNQLLWKDRSGRLLSKVGTPTREVGFTLSPDENGVVMSRAVSEKTSDLWLEDLTRGTASRLTSDASLNSTPVWSADGRRVVFSSNRTGNYDIYIKDVRGGGPEEAAFASPQYKITSDWSRDGRYILFAVFDNAGVNRTGPDLWVLPLDGSRKAAPYLETPFAETHGQFSPDTRWIAYTSDESGRFEIYVRPFPAAPGKWLVSVHGGRLPRWLRDGKELCYLSPEGKLMAVSLKPTPGPPAALEVGVPQELFDTQSPSRPGPVNWFTYAPAADGHRFLVNTRSTDSETTPLTVVVNWLGALKR